jgi:two-component system CheB/CheR fusion protein
VPSHRTQATPRTRKRRQFSAVRPLPPVKTDDENRLEDRGDRILIVGVGASAGGLEAFTLLLKHVPVNTGMGFVLVQHLDPMHESALTQILAKATPMPVREAANNLPVEPNHPQRQGKLR